MENKKYRILDGANQTIGFCTIRQAERMAQRIAKKTYPIGRWVGTAAVIPTWVSLRDFEYIRLEIKGL